MMQNPTRKAPAQVTCVQNVQRTHSGNGVGGTGTSSPFLHLSGYFCIFI